MITQWAPWRNILFFYGLTNSWTVMNHKKALATARPFILCRAFWSLLGFFSFSGSSLLPFWGITSIKITGLGDQLLLRVLSLLLLASFFCGLNTPACSNKCLNHRWSAPRLSVTRSRRTCDWRSPFVLSSPFTFYTSTIPLLLISLVEFRW